MLLGHPVPQHVSDDFLEEIALARNRSSDLSDGLEHIKNCAYCRDRLEAERETIQLIQNTLRADPSGMVTGPKRLVVVGPNVSKGKSS
jgi:hypothetical protein